MLRRIWRHLRNGATVLSLLLCIAVVWQWSWSHQRNDLVRYAHLLDGGTAYRTYSLLSAHGGMQLSMRSRSMADRPGAQGPFQAGWRAVARPSVSFNAMDELANETDGGVVLKLPGLQMRTERDGRGFRQFQLRVATAWLLAATAVLPLMALYRLRYRPPHACARCGYDLRATPARCPECGLETTKAA